MYLAYQMLHLHHHKGYQEYHLHFWQQSWAQCHAQYYKRFASPGGARFHQSLAAWILLLYQRKE